MVAGRRPFGSPLHAPWTAREMALMARDLGKRGVTPTGGCCSTSPTAVGKARGARIRTGRLYSCTRTIDDKPRNYGSAKDRCREGQGKDGRSIGRLSPYHFRIGRLSPYKTGRVKLRVARRVWRDYYRHSFARRHNADPSTEGLADQQREWKIREDDWRREAQERARQHEFWATKARNLSAWAPKGMG